MCDLSDRRIIETYTAIVEGDSTDWLILGYNDTRDVISLYSKGDRGLSEFREHLSDEVLYGFVRVDDRFILITWVSEQVSGVRRARALVHSRSVAALLKLHHAQVTASSINDISDANIRTRLKLNENQVPNRSRPNSVSNKRASLSAARRQSSSPTATPDRAMSPSPVTDQDPTAEPESFVEASEGLSEDEEQNEEEKKRVAEENRKRAEAEANAKARAEAEAKQRAEAKARAEAEARAREMAEAQRKQAEDEARAEEERKKQVELEKQQLQKRLLEAEKNKDVVLAGFASVQPSNSPFWRRRYFLIRGKSLLLYRDELDKAPITVIDLGQVTRLSAIDAEEETFVPNAFVLDTQQEESYQMFADDKKDADTIMTALKTVIRAN
ncbi:hypothetical protein DFQ28_005478 [Apophysomyces sp. BC1034]|nr:hypothetical protein DFQ29_008727 [Apophysomyces sp. BC1021]KAG0172599.1 hypothetical protein DFQ30_010125 [Apophysomyces sp. BC1015]KAG0188028.1 hypothetical protein DFQ28_005478 [Apophysomyces sp. BC1034]